MIPSHLVVRIRFLFYFPKMVYFWFPSAHIIFMNFDELTVRILDVKNSFLPMVFVENHGTKSWADQGPGQKIQCVISRHKWFTIYQLFTNWWSEVCLEWHRRLFGENDTSSDEATWSENQIMKHPCWILYNIWLTYQRFSNIQIYILYILFTECHVVKKCQTFSLYTYIIIYIHIQWMMLVFP